MPMKLAVAACIFLELLSCCTISSALLSFAELSYATFQSRPHITKLHVASQDVPTAYATTRIVELLSFIRHKSSDEVIANELSIILGDAERQLVNSIMTAQPDRKSWLIERPHLLIQHPILAEHILQQDARILSTEQWFTQYLKLTKADRTKIQSRLPTVGNQIMSIGRYRLKQWFVYFLSDIGLAAQELRKMITARPILLSYKLSNVQSTANFFRDEVGLSKSELKSIITSYPSVLMFSVTSRLRPHVHFLQDEIGGGKENWKAWKKVICTYPQFFSHSLDKTLLPKIQFFCDKQGILGLKKSELSQVVAKFPPTLWLSDQNLIDKFDYLTESLELSAKELRGIVVSYPQLLGLSLENNLKPKMGFFLGNDEKGAVCDDVDFDCGMTRKELKEFVIYQPALLAYSLEGRLKPRIQQMDELGVLFQYCPKNIMSYTDEKFSCFLSAQTDCWTIID
jgi:mTERF domain-containing protein